MYLSQFFINFFSEKNLWNVERLFRPTIKTPWREMSNFYLARLAARASAVSILGDKLTVRNYSIHWTKQYMFIPRDAMLEEPA